MMSRSESVEQNLGRHVFREGTALPRRVFRMWERVPGLRCRLSCCFERLKRAGRFEDVLIDDPFDPEGAVSVKLTEAEWRSVNPASTPRDSSHGPHDFSLN